eukprot:GHVQ01023811.1.p2 GENE.GHVQ01023811.1~~GHVQ01023811.1.p2  ORF type:complete len:249 (+),score=17.21 GHVQ01023811.1:68-814(+)
MQMTSLVQHVSRRFAYNLYLLTGQLGTVGIHPNGYWKGDLGYVHDQPFGDHLLRFLLTEGCRSVVDVGCGLADYLKLLRREGLQCLGFDGNTKIIHLTEGLCLGADVGYPLPLIEASKKKGFQFPADWALCLGVGQHLPRSREAQFLENLSLVQSRGLIISWDLPYTLTPGAHNFKTSDEVRYLFNDVLGYRYDEEATMLMRDAATVQTLKDSVFCYRNDDDKQSVRREFEAERSQRIQQHFEETKML